MRQFILTDFEKKNSNKVWKVEVSGTTVTTYYGRVGQALQSSTKSFGSSYMAERFASAKITEKMEKGYREIEVIETTTQKTEKVDKNTILRQISVSPEAEKFIQRIIDANVHSIMSQTTLTRNTDGLFATPLGIVTPRNIDQARNILAQASSPNANLPRLTSDYLMLIPHDVGMKIDLSILSTPERIRAENDILDALQSSWDTAQNNPSDMSEVSKDVPLFDITFELINNSRDAEEITNFFNGTKSTHHIGRSSAKVLNVFKLGINNLPAIDMTKTPVRVFHGTGQGNLLSIMQKGLMISPPSSTIITGKMFGNGIYGAVNSTKSMGYTRQGYGNSGWMFVCQFQMGRYYHPNRTINTPPDGYDSVWARANDCGLLHDELIVYKPSHAQITHLLEFTS